MRYDEDLILDWADRFSTIEVCGYVWEDGLTLPMMNIAKNPDRSFVMDLEQQAEVHAAYGFPVACWHSHPGGSAEPSSWDRLFHAQAELRMLIVADGRVYDYGQAPFALVPQGAEGL